MAKSESVSMKALSNALTSQVRTGIKILGATMVKRTNLEVADILESFVEGTGTKWDWDDFCSLRIENHDLDAIRVECINLAFTYPPFPGDGYCNAEGIQLLRKIAKDLRKLPE